VSASYIILLNIVLAQSSEFVSDIIKGNPIVNGCIIFILTSK
jgi:hypothetical protein